MNRRDTEKQNSRGAKGAGGIWTNLCLRDSAEAEALLKFGGERKPLPNHSPESSPFLLGSTAGTHARTELLPPASFRTAFIGGVADPRAPWTTTRD